MYIIYIYIYIIWMIMSMYTYLSFGERIMCRKIVGPASIFAEEERNEITS